MKVVEVKNKEKIIGYLTKTVQEMKEEAAEKEKSDSSEEEGLGELKDDIAEIKEGVGKLVEQMNDEVYVKEFQEMCIDDLKSKINDNSKEVGKNKPVNASLAEKYVEVIKIVKQGFPKARILYVMHPTSKSEPLVADLLHEELKAAWQKDAITSDENSQVFLCGSAECLASGSGNDSEVSIPGYLPWTAAVKLAKEIYRWIFPDSSSRFSDCCSRIHIVGTCNKVSKCPNNIKWKYATQFFISFFSAV